jgi:hypothetical protein
MSMPLKYKTDAQGRVIYSYRGRVERGIGGRYVWRKGYSATTQDGGVLYPWMTKRECQRQAKAEGHKAVFQEELEKHV